MADEGQDAAAPTLRRAVDVDVAISVSPPPRRARPQRVATPAAIVVASLIISPRPHRCSKGADRLHCSLLSITAAVAVDVDAGSSSRNLRDQCPSPLSALPSQLLRSSGRCRSPPSLTLLEGTRDRGKDYRGRGKISQMR